MCPFTHLELRRAVRADLPADTVALARWLIGKLVVRVLSKERLVGRIVETEGYLPDDPACHAYGGMTLRNRSLFLKRGHAYVYLAYGTSWMLNVSSETDGVGAGVLIRALHPLEGIERMQRNRGAPGVRDLCRGPGRLAAALAIDRRLDGIDLCADTRLWLAGDGAEVGEIGESRRIGITKAAERVLRFYVRGSPFVSGPSRLRS